MREITNIILVSYLGYTTHLKISEAMVTYKEKTGEEEPPSDKDLTRLQLYTHGCRGVEWESKHKFNFPQKKDIFVAEFVSFLLSINPIKK